MKLITASQFEKARQNYNTEVAVRKIVMDDIDYLFSLYGDSFDMNKELIRMKPVRSPFTQKEYFLEGTLKLEKPAGTKNTILFSAANKAGPRELPFLRDEAQEYQQKRLPPSDTQPLIKSVDLNSEQVFQYNLQSKMMSVVTLSDVIVIDLSNRGNIRKYELWEVYD
jgi:hypothetical protein